MTVSRNEWNSRTLRVIAIAGLTIGVLNLQRGKCSTGPTAKAAAATLTPSTACKQLGLPQEMGKIPLSPRAYEMDRGRTANYIMGIIDRQIDPPIHLAIPRLWGDNRVNKATGLIRKFNSEDYIWKQSTESLEKGEEGIFIDVGGWVGDSSIPSAALGIDTYVFEPVRINSNMIHLSALANDCVVSEHLTVVNAKVGDRDIADETIYVTAGRSDNAASSKEQATKNVGATTSDYEQPVETVRLDSFFPPGTKVLYMKVDVQGYELMVLKGAERILRENKGRIQVRFEYHEGLLRAAGTNPEDLLDYMKGLGYEIVRRGEDIDMI